MKIDDVKVGEEYVRDMYGLSRWVNPQLPPVKVKVLEIVTETQEYGGRWSYAKANYVGQKTRNVRRLKVEVTWPAEYDQRKNKVEVQQTTISAKDLEGPYAPALARWNAKQEQKASLDAAVTELRSVLAPFGDDVRVKSTSGVDGHLAVIMTPAAAQQIASIIHRMNELEH